MSFRRSPRSATQSNWRIYTWEICGRVKAQQLIVLGLDTEQSSACPFGIGQKGLRIHIYGGIESHKAAVTRWCCGHIDTKNSRCVRIGYILRSERVHLSRCC